MKTITHWFYLLIVLVVVIVVWGALVRLTNSGLSIPDWPLINGSLLPPTSETEWQAVLKDYKDEAYRLDHPQFPVDVELSEFIGWFWIEYFHRALAAITGLVFIGLAIFVFRHREAAKLIKTNIIIIFALLIAQAGLGGIVVKGALEAALIASHLVLAYIFFGLIIWTVLTLHRPEVEQGQSRSSGLIPIRITILTLGALIIQVIFGGLVAGTHAGYIFNTFPMMGGVLIPQFSNFAIPDKTIFSNPVFLQFFHRWWWVIVLVLYGRIEMTTGRLNLIPRAKLFKRTAGILFVLQIIIGILNLILKVPLHVSLTHSFIGICLFGALIALLHDLRYGVRDQRVIGKNA